MEAKRVYNEKYGGRKWKPADRTKILAYIGLVITAGHPKTKLTFFERSMGQKV